MKRLLLSVCIPALTFFGFSLKAHAAETHSAPAFMNAEGEGIFPKGKTNDAYAQYFNGTSYLQALSTEGVAIANVTFEPGDVVNIPAGVKHWHGAAKDSWFSHLAVAVPAEGASNEWLEQVSDEEYQQLK